jgi:hypothetical protein
MLGTRHIVIFTDLCAWVQDKIVQNRLECKRNIVNNPMQLAVALHLPSIDAYLHNKTERTYVIWFTPSTTQVLPNIPLTLNRVGSSSNSSAKTAKLLLVSLCIANLLLPADPARNFRMVLPPQRSQV